MSKIYRVDFGEKEKGETVEELFDSIQLYRQEGKSLTKIHAAFCKAGLWQKSLSSFCNEYYQYRSEKGESTGDRQSKKPPSKRRAAKSTEKSNRNENDADTDLPIDNRTGIRADMTLEERRKISAELFRKRNQ